MKHSQDKIWEYYQGEAVSSFDSNYTRLNFILNHIPKNSNVLNIGVGNAYLERIALKREIKISSLDPDDDSMKRVAQELNIETKAGYSTAIPWEADSFDVIIMSEVIEHLKDEDIRLTLNEIKRCLKNGGHFLGTVPANEILSQNHVICPNCEHQFHRWGHQQSYSEERLKATLSQLSLTPTIKRCYFPAWKNLNLFGKLEAGLKHFFMFLGKKGANENYFFSVKKETRYP